MVRPKNIDWLCDVFISAAIGTLNGYVFGYAVFGSDNSAIGALSGCIVGAIMGGLLESKWG